MSKELHTAIMKRSRNIFLQHRTDTNKKTIAHKEISVKKLSKNTKKSYFENLDTYKKITDKRSFWRTVLPLFTQNSSKGEKINLVHDAKTISSDKELCETFKQFFSNVVPTLNILKRKSFPMANENLDPIKSVINSLYKRPSIVTL